MSAATSQRKVISTVALTLESFINHLKNASIEDLKVVYDEKLSYETTVAAIRAQNNQNSTNNISGDDPTNLYPVFSFRRSPLRYVDPAAQGRRLSGANCVNYKNPETGKGSVFKVAHAEFDINFLYIAKSIADLEAWEVLYLAEDGITATKEIKVILQEEGLPDLTYFLTYGDLEDKNFEYEQNYYKSLTGTIKVRGFYPVLREEAKLILRIESRIRDWSETIISTTTIIP